MNFNTLKDIVTGELEIGNDYYAFPEDIVNILTGLGYNLSDLGVDIFPATLYDGKTYYFAPKDEVNSFLPVMQDLLINGNLKILDYINSRSLVQDPTTGD